MVSKCGLQKVKLKLVVLLFILLGFLFESYSQDFDKFGNAPNHLGNNNSGFDENFSLPLYTIDYKGLKIPILLSYNGSGVRVFDEPTEVGLGWQISKGISITRNVNGLADESAPCDVEELPYANFFPSGTTWGGWLVNTEVDQYSLLNYNSNVTGDKGNFEKIKDYLLSNAYDLQPDEYTLILPGNRQFDFFFSKNGEVKFLNTPNIKFESHLLSTGIVKFEVVDSDGTKYSFVGGNSIRERRYGKKISSPFFSSFVINEIAFVTGDVIKFFYRTDVRVTTQCNRTIYHQGNYYSMGIGDKIIIEDRLVLDSIVTPQESVLFHYDIYSDDRYKHNSPTNFSAPEAYDKQHKLREVEVRERYGMETLKYQLFYSSYLDQRSKLDSIFYGNGIKMSLFVKFDYDLQIDTQYGNLFKQDCFGYYNSNTADHLFSNSYGHYQRDASRSFHPGKILSGILKKVTYGSGRGEIFDYKVKHDMFFEPLEEKDAYAGGVVLSKVSYINNPNGSIVYKDLISRGLHGVFYDFSDAGFNYKDSMYGIYSTSLNLKGGAIYKEDRFDEFMRRRGSFYRVNRTRMRGLNNESNGSVETHSITSKNRFDYNPKIQKEKYYREGTETPYKWVDYSYSFNANPDSLFFVEYDRTYYYELFNRGRFEPYYRGITTSPRQFYSSIDEKLSSRTITEVVGGREIKYVENYFYNRDGEPIRIETRNTDGKVHQKMYSYSSDFEYLYSNNMDDAVRGIGYLKEKGINRVLESIEVIDDLVVSGKVYGYSEGISLPTKEYRLCLSKPLPISLINGFMKSSTGGSHFLFDKNYVLEKEFAYDVKENLVAQRVNGKEVAFKWGYDLTRQFARIANSYDHNSSLIFNFDDPSILSRFQFRNAGVTSLSFLSKNLKGCSLSGGKASSFSTVISSTFFKPSTSYTIEIIGNIQQELGNAGVRLNYANKNIVHVFENQSSGRCYAKITISSGTSPSNLLLEVKNGLSGESPRGKLHILQIRIYPNNQVVESFASSMLYGKTCVINSNGWATFYEYDELGRVSIIRDAHGNIIESKEYNAAN